MSATTEESIPNAQQLKDLQVAHVLYMDLVDYSSLPLEQQPQLLARLQDTVRATAEFQCASEREELLCLPSGDGMALAFFRDPVAPIRCALEIASVLKQHPRIKLRMGIHSGPVYRLADINANNSIAGSGINTAQRVMDCGDAGHILLSQAAAAVLIQMGRWQNALHDIGYCEAKHGERLHLYNLWTESLGNPNLPARLANRATVAALLSDLSTHRDAARAREIENHYALLLGTTNERQMIQCGAAFLAVEAECAAQRVPDLAQAAFARAPLLTAIQAILGDGGLSAALPGATPPVTAPGAAAFVKALNELPRRHVAAMATRLRAQQCELMEIPERLRNSLERSDRELLTQATERLMQGMTATGAERVTLYHAAMSALRQGLQSRATRRDYIVWFQIGWLEWKANGNLAAAEEAFARAARLGSVNRDGYYRESLRHLAYLRYLCGNAVGAYQTITDLLPLQADYEVFFDAARYAALTKHTAEAEQILSECLQRSPAAIIPILAETDFQPMQPSLSKLLDGLREQAGLLASATVREWNKELEMAQGWLARADCGNPLPQELGSESARQATAQLAAADYLSALAIGSQATAAAHDLYESVTRIFEEERQTRETAYADARAALDSALKAAGWSDSEALNRMREEAAAAERAWEKLAATPPAIEENAGAGCGIMLAAAAGVTLLVILGGSEDALKSPPGMVLGFLALGGWLILPIIRWLRYWSDVNSARAQAVTKRRIAEEAYTRIVAKTDEAVIAQIHTLQENLREAATRQKLLESIRALVQARKPV